MNALFFVFCFIIKCLWPKKKFLCTISSFFCRLKKKKSYLSNLHCISQVTLYLKCSQKSAIRGSYKNNAKTASEQNIDIHMIKKVFHIKITKRLLQKKGKKVQLVNPLRWKSGVSKINGRLCTSIPWTCVVYRKKVN